ncbi:OmpA family protein [Aquimarina sp. TRL1]|uniref:OmpA family protein n=1 Tax=Aquimarina sp. (strain TRL1) TaxID=2736252 RepID=UPI00158AEA5D|nr:OmpA family protein [Aquimarina sp. TRL1]QKX06531.1 OmpA family protein [Aquimarina sp. TRL1]
MSKITIPQNTITYFIYPLICVLCCNQVFSQVEVPLEKRTEFTLKGDMTFVSNTILGKVSNDNGSGVFNPNKSYNNGGLNNQFRMGFIDIDNDASTFNSSSADLILSSECAKIKHVGLYWTAAYADKNREHDISSIKIKYPGHTAYSTVSNGQIIYDYYQDEKSIFKQYSCYKDITKEVLSLQNPIGTYTVANIPATTTEKNNDKALGNGLAGGWTMIVIYEDNSKQRKRFYIYDGFVNIDAKAKPVSFSFDNFQTIPKGAVNSRIGVISYEGDKGIKGDRFQVLSHATGKYKSLVDGSNPMNNFFNANITENGKNIKSRVPASENTLGYDADIFDIKNSKNSIIGNNQSKAGFRLLTDNDGYSVMAVAFSIEIYEPAIHMVKRSRHTASNEFIYPTDELSPNQEITYSLTIHNDGNDNAKNTIIKDILPENVSFVKGSLTLPSKRIKFSYNDVSKNLTFRVPDKMLKMTSDPFEITYKVRLNTDCSNLISIDDLTVTDQPVIAEFNGSLNDTKRYSKGYNYINKCNLPDYYQFNLAIDIRDLNCPNAISLANLPKKNIQKNYAAITGGSSDQSNNTSDITENSGDGLDEKDITNDSNTSSIALKSPVKYAQNSKTINELIDLKEIYFDFDKWDITEKAATELDRIVTVMTKRFPDMVIKIETHSDSRGNKDYNLILSQKRAESIYNYLINTEISKDRIISYRGYGENKPTNNCGDGQHCSEEEYQKNRRSEFVIVENIDKTNKGISGR